MLDLQRNGRTAVSVKRTPAVSRDELGVFRSVSLLFNPDVRIIMEEYLISHRRV